MNRRLRVVLLVTVCPLSALPAAEDKKDTKAAVKFEIRRAEDKPAEGLEEATVGDSKKKVYLHKKAELTREDVAAASAIKDSVSGRLAVSVDLTKEGANKMRKLSEDWKGKRLAILIDGKVVIAPLVNSTLDDKIEISGKLTKEEVETLVKSLNAK
jgi:preprotein translocase subunit SecD